MAPSQHPREALREGSSEGCFEGTGAESAVAAIGAIVIEVGGGLLLLSGYRVRFASLVLAVFSLVTAVFFHRNFADQNQMIHFLKNVMMAGGLLQVTYFGAGSFSLDARSEPTALSAA